MTVASVGTTAEVLAVKEDVDNLSGLAATRIKAIGRQRFKVLSTMRQLGGFDSFFVDASITFCFMPSCPQLLQVMLGPCQRTFGHCSSFSHAICPSCNALCTVD